MQSKCNHKQFDFDTEDSEFARGVQFGYLWHQLKSGETKFIVRSDNLEMCTRLSDLYGTKLRIINEMHDDLIEIVYEDNWTED